MINRHLLAALVFFLTLPVATWAQTCTLDNDYCVPVFGCVPSAGETFRGSTFGQRKGSVQVTSSTGVICKGRWKRTAFGGKATVACSDGRKGSLKFNYFNAQTGTVGGLMTLSNGDEAEILAGHRVSAFLKSGKKIRGKTPACRALIEPMLQGG